MGKLHGFTRDGRMYTGVVLNTEPSAHVADEKVETKEENMEILLDENVNDKQGVAARHPDRGYYRHGSTYGHHGERLHQEPLPG